jgi:hypothetical protein
MEQNPYEPPKVGPSVPWHSRIRHSKGLVGAIVAIWAVFFLLPAIVVSAVRLAINVFPIPPMFDPPSGDTILSRSSIILGVPMGPVLLVSLLGCAVSAACLPTKHQWKVVAILGWVPLVVLQILAIALALVLLGYPPAI